MDGPLTETAPAARRVPAPAAPARRAEPRRLAVIFNPTAGRRKGRRLGAALALLRGEGRLLRLERTAARGDAEAIARRVGSAETLVVAGGDGTANEAANGLLAAGGGRLALIPLGTANVLAAELGIGNL
jgi:diacylglycerol kinase (ATP)